MNGDLFFDIAGLVYIIATVVYVVYFAFRNKTFGIAATITAAFGFVIQSTGLIVRWIGSYNMWVLENPASPFAISLLRSAPLRNLYESLIFFVWALVLIYLIMEFIYKNRSLGAFVIPLTALALLFIDVLGTSKAVELSNPALQSNWLPFHVLMSFAGYAAFGVSFGTGLMSLILTSERQKESYVFWLALSGVFVVILTAALLSGQLAISTVLTSAAVLVILDLILNYRVIKNSLKNKDSYSKTAKSGYILLIAALLLFDVAMIYVMTLIEENIIVPMIAGAMVFIKYLLLKKDTYLFWTATLGISLVVMFAMGIDFVILKTSPRPEVMQSTFLKSTFRNSAMSVAVFSWAASIAFVFIIWRFGNGIKKLLSAFPLTSDMLDDITYKCIAIGFPLFTIGGLLMGAIWAKGAWGRYWGWDPKETWSLITWFVYALYLHARFVSGWNKRVAILAVIGFAGVIITYLGVNLVLPGLHSYGSG
jgi:cytochrome c-type biogenesis protein CcsB